MENSRVCCTYKALLWVSFHSVTKVGNSTVIYLKCIIIIIITIIIITVAFKNKQKTRFYITPRPKEISLGKDALEHCSF